MLNPRIIALTEQGLAVAQQIVQQIPKAEISFKPSPFKAQVQSWFKQKQPLIFICATGIVVRSLAEVLANKHEDPPVLVVDEQARYVIPLLSGHEGGANQWAAQLAKQLSAEAVITSAQQYTQPIYSLGIGCERGCPATEIAELAQSCLAQAGLDIEQISSINSLDIKADEQGLIEFAKSVNKPYQTWSVVELSQMESRLNQRSDYVFKTVGLYGVAESAALYAVHKLGTTEPELILNKQKIAKATCAIALSYRD